MLWSAMVVDFQIVFEHFRASSEKMGENGRFGKNQILEIWKSALHGTEWRQETLNCIHQRTTIR
jgi:hypothetical protein